MLVIKPILRGGMSGYSLIEVMITLFVIAVGLLGLAGLQGRAVLSEKEANSRGQALMLANDLADRMNANLASVKSPAGAATYNQHDGGGANVFAVGNTLNTFGTGSGNVCAAKATASDRADCCADKTVNPSVAQRDLCEWDLSLRGSGESSSTKSSIGAMEGARGCVFLKFSGPDDKGIVQTVYEVDVVWRGRDSTGAVANDLVCGAVDIPANRRGVSRRMRIADLDAS